MDVVGHREPHLRVSTNGPDHASLVSNFLREGRGLVANETVIGLGGVALDGCLSQCVVHLTALRLNTWTFVMPIIEWPLDLEEA